MSMTMSENWDLLLPRWNVNFDLMVNRDHRRVASRLGSDQVIISHDSRDTSSSVGHKNGCIRLNIVRAVRGTTGIEGTELTEEEVSDVLKSDVRFTGFITQLDRERSVKSETPTV